MCALIHGGKLALIVHLQQLQSSGAVAHLVDSVENELHGVRTDQLKNRLNRLRPLSASYPLVVWVDSYSHYSASGEAGKLGVLELQRKRAEDSMFA